MPRVYIGIGANSGPRMLSVERSLERLAQRGFRIVRRSPVYETEPVGMNGARKFLNLVVAADTRLAPAACLDALLAIERELGRGRHAHNAPRRIDLDLLLYGQRGIQTPRLTIPHPRMHERAFVLRPLADIASHLIHPTQHRRVSSLLRQVGEDGVKLWSGPRSSSGRSR